MDQLFLLSGWNFVTLLFLELSNPLARALLVLLGCYEIQPPIPSVQHPSVMTVSVSLYLASPLKNLPIAIKSSWSEQLNTTVWIASALPRSFVVSVLPVPAGPAGAPPNFRCRAPVSVR